MYKCTECNKLYEECPEFCDCGNDEFEEIYEEQYSEPVRSHSPKIKKAVPKMSEEEQEEYDREMLDKKKALIAIGVSLLLSVIILFLPPYRQKKIEKVAEKAKVANVQLPSVNSYWDDSLPSAFVKKDPLHGLPLLNKNFSSISPVLREYLVNIGNQFNRLWDSSSVQGSGECKVLFVIDREGNLTAKKIITSSNNESLDDSVLLLLSKVTNLDVPPDDYKGEKIYISFKVDQNQGSKVYYPMK